LGQYPTDRNDDDKGSLLLRKGRVLKLPVRAPARHPLPFELLGRRTTIAVGVKQIREAGSPLAE